MVAATMSLARTDEPMFECPQSQSALASPDVAGMCLQDAEPTLSTWIVL